MVLTEIFHREHSDIVADNFRTFLENETYIDLIFVCRANRKVGAHQMVMGFLSKFLSDLLVQNQNESKDKVIYVYVPDIRAKIMRHILQFIYTGKVMINREELGEFNDDLILLGMPLSVITSVDRGQPANTEPLQPAPAPNYSNAVNAANFPLPSPDSTFAISAVGSLANNVFTPTSSSPSVVTGMRYLNQPDQLIQVKPPDGSSAINPYASVYSQAPIQSLPVSSTALGLGQPTLIPSIAQISAEIITTPSSTRSCSSTSNAKSTSSSTPSKNNSTPSKSKTQKRLKSQRNNGTKQSKTTIDQCIDLAGSDDDSDIITIT